VVQVRRIPLVLVLVLLVVVPGARAWTWPGDGQVLRSFVFDPAHPYAGGQHRGVAVGAAPGTPVAASAGGTVTFAGSVPGSGAAVAIRTPDGYSVTLVHLGSVAVARGATVAEGDVIGSVGADGYVHLGVRVASDPNGYVDPLGFLPPRLVVPSAPAVPEPAGVVPIPEPVPGAAPPAAADSEGTPPPPVAAPPGSAPAADPAPPATEAAPSAAGEGAPASGEVVPSVETAAAAEPAPAAGEPAAAEPVAAEPAPAAPPARPESAAPFDVAPGAAPAAAPAAAPTVEPVVPADDPVDPTAADEPSAAEPIATAAPAAAAGAPAAAAAEASGAPVAAAAPEAALPSGVTAVAELFGRSVQKLVPDVAAGGPSRAPVLRVSRLAEVPVRVPAAEAVPRAAARPDAAPTRAARAPAGPPHRALPSGGRRQTLRQPNAASSVAARAIEKRRGPRALVLVGLLLPALAAAAGLLKAARMISASRPTRPEGAAAVRESAEDPGRSRLAVCERPEAHRPRGGVRGAVRHLRAVPQAEGERHPDGERDGRARDAGDGGGGPGRRLAA
jgi:hypothetical protein